MQPAVIILPGQPLLWIGHTASNLVAAFPRVDFHRQIAKAFYGGFGYKPQTTEGTCNEDICSQFMRNYKRSNFYEQIQSSPFQNS